MAWELSFPRTFALEYSLPGTFAPWNFYSLLVHDIIWDIRLYCNDMYLSLGHNFSHNKLLNLCTLMYLLFKTPLAV